MFIFRKFLKTRKELGCLLDLYKNQSYVTCFVNIRCRINRLEDIVDLVPSSGRILDIGCGYGIFGNLLALKSPHRNVTGVDIDARKLKYANRGLKNAAFKVSDGTDLALTDYDGITIIDVLHHLNSYADQEKLIMKCFGALNPHGKLIIKEVNDKPKHKYMIAKIIDNLLYVGDKFYFRNEAQWESLLGNLGFGVLSIPLHEGTPTSSIVYVAEKP